MPQIVDQIELERLEREYQNSLVKMFCPDAGKNNGNSFDGLVVAEPSFSFEKLNYRYLGNLEYPKGCDSRKDGGKNSPLREEALRLWLKTRSNKDGSPKYTSNQIEEAISTLKKTILLDNPLCNRQQQLPLEKLLYKIMLLFLNLFLYYLLNPLIRM